MRLLYKEWVADFRAGGMHQATELIQVGESLEALRRLASDRALHKDKCDEIVWIWNVDGRGEGCLWLPVRDEFRYVIRRPRPGPPSAMAPRTLS